MKPPVVVLAMLAALASAPASARTLTIGVDLSASNPVITSEQFARAAANRVRAEIASLQLGDTVQVRRFGERDAAKMPGETLHITRKLRAGKVADMVAHYIASLPAKTPQGDGQTNIVAFLEFGSRFDCANAGRVLLLTDGIESSSYIGAKDFLAGKPLPAPDPGILKSCEVEMWGFGQSKDGQIPPQAVKTIRAAWTAWMKEAGASFTAIIDP